MSSTSDATTSATTSVDLSRSLRPPPERTSSRSPLGSTSPLERNTGAIPKTRPVSAVRTNAKIMVRTSIDGTSADGNDAGTSAASSGIANTASTTPRPPPSAASTRLSVAS